MNKLEVSDAVAYLDMLSGVLHELSQSSATMNDKPVVFCNPEAFKGMADKLAGCSRTIRVNMFGESEEEKE